MFYLISNKISFLVKDTYKFEFSCLILALAKHINQGNNRVVHVSRETVVVSKNIYVSTVQNIEIKVKTPLIVCYIDPNRSGSWVNINNVFVFCNNHRTGTHSNTKTRGITA